MMKFLGQIHRDYYTDGENITVSKNHRGGILFFIQFILYWIIFYLLEYYTNHNLSIYTWYVHLTLAIIILLVTSLGYALRYNFKWSPKLLIPYPIVWVLGK